MPKLTEVFKIKEGDVVPFKKPSGGGEPPKPPPSGTGRAVAALKQLSDRAEGLANTKALQGLAAVAQNLDEMTGDEPEFKQAQQLFTAFVKAFGKAVELT